MSGRDPKNWPRVVLDRGPGPMSGREFDALVRGHQRHHAIPGYLDSVDAWLAKIRAKTNDIRSTSQILAVRGGKQFTNGVMDLAKIAAHAGKVRQAFESGDFLLALSMVADLKSRIAAANARLENQDAVRGQKVKQGAVTGAATRAQKGASRDRQIVALYWQCAETVGRKRALAEIMMKFQLSRSAAFAAIGRGKKMVRPAAKQD